MMADADAVLTGYALAIGCAVFAWRSGRATPLTCWSRRLDHNALFHVVQGVAFALLFPGFRRLEGRTERCSPDATY